MLRFARNSTLLLLLGGIGLSAVPQEKSNDIKIKLVQLSKVLGQTHAIHVSCNGRADQYWRNQMYALLELEAPEEGHLKDTLVNAFNSGFESEQKISTICDIEARARFSALARDGQSISEELNTEISNPIPE